MTVSIELPCNSVFVTLNDLIKVIGLQRKVVIRKVVENSLDAYLIIESILSARWHVGDYPCTLASILGCLKFLNSKGKNPVWVGSSEKSLD